MTESLLCLNTYLREIVVSLPSGHGPIRLALHSHTCRALHINAPTKRSSTTLKPDKNPSKQWFVESAFANA